MMKNLLTGALALMMCCAMAVSVFAEDTMIDQNTTDKKGETEVSFNVEPTYTITIPGAVELKRSILTAPPPTKRIWTSSPRKASA